MDDTMEGPAPWSRPQKQAAIGLPMTLGVAALMLLKVFAGPFSLPGWAPPLILAVVLALVVALILLPRRSECPDERDWQIVLKASRRAFVFLLMTLLLPLTLRRVFTDGPPEWDAELLAMAIAMLGQSVYFGSVLQLYRSTEQG